MVELYVYYRVDVTRGEAASMEIERQQAGLRAAIDGLQTRLLRRAEDTRQGADDATWMEVYRRPGGLDADCCARIEAALQALPTGRNGPRIVERFEALDPDEPAAPLS